MSDGHKYGLGDRTSRLTSRGLKKGTTGGHEVIWLKVSVPGLFQLS